MDEQAWFVFRAITAAVGCLNTIPTPIQQVRDALSVILVIVNNENAANHAAILC